MKQDVKTEWVKRLRSGMYLQGYRRLRADFQGKAYYCCLGVLCEMAMEAGIVLRGRGLDGAFRYTTVSNTPSQDSSGTYLPQAVREWSDLGEVAVHRLACLNDHCHSFSHIADIIETEY